MKAKSYKYYFEPELSELESTLPDDDDSDAESFFEALEEELDLDFSGEGWGSPETELEDMLALEEVLALLPDFVLLWSPIVELFSFDDESVVESFDLETGRWNMLI